MFFQNLTRGIEIGANCYLLSLGDSRILLDAGMHPGETGRDALPALDGVEFDSIDSLVLSHAHLDHAGSLPVILRQQPSAQVFMTEPTKDLAVAMLHNSVNVMTSQRWELGVAEYPLFSHREIDTLQHDWQTPRVYRPFPIGNENDAIDCEFFNAGHILGAVGVLFRFRGQTIFYTGDVHFEDQSLTRAAHFPREQVDVLIMETTRGAEQRSPGYTRAGETENLALHIRTALDRGGAVLIPVFALGKTQETLTILAHLKRDGAIRDAPVYLGGLSAKMTTIYDRHAGNSHRHHADFRIFEQMDLVLSSRRQRKEIPYEPGSIYALSSGMMTENTLSNDFARNILPDSRNGLFFVGYTAPSSPGGRILASEPGDNLRLKDGDPVLARDCEVKKFDFSGHGTREAMLEFVRGARPRQVFLIHGDKDATAWFQKAIKTILPSCDVVVATPEEKVALKVN